MTKYVVVMNSGIVEFLMIFDGLRRCEKCNWNNITLEARVLEVLGDGVGLVGKPDEPIILDRAARGLALEKLDDETSLVGKPFFNGAARSLAHANFLDEAARSLASFLDDVWVNHGLGNPMSG